MVKKGISFCVTTLRFYSQAKIYMQHRMVDAIMSKATVNLHMVALRGIFSAQQKKQKTTHTPTCIVHQIQLSL